MKSLNTNGKNYTKSCSVLGCTARELVLNRLQKVSDMIEDGRTIKDTDMTRAFAAAVS